MRHWFGTDGIRGVANRPPVTAETALALGRALVRLHAVDRQTHVLIGRDTRRSGPMLASALAAGVAAEGGRATQVGVLPTPGVARLTADGAADFGVVISASHNPYADNGLKVFGSDGYKLTDETEARVESHMRDALGADGIVGGACGVIDELPDAKERYIASVRSAFPASLRLDGLRLVLDCAQGAAFETAPRLLRDLGAEVYVECAEPNGLNINDGCGALHPERAGARVRELGAHAGLALDGDADRLIMVDERGETVDGDAMMAICAMQMLHDDTLHDRTLVTTVMSNLGLEIAMREAGVRMLRTDVGDRYVVEAMRAGGFSLGGEQSGHLIFHDRTTTGDGGVAALSVLSVLIAENRPLSELASTMTRLPQVLINLRVREKPVLNEIVEVRDAIARVESILGDHGRVLVRYSGTEPKARVMIEGPDQSQIELLAQDLVDAISTAIGA